MGLMHHRQDDAEAGHSSDTHQTRKTEGGLPPLRARRRQGHRILVDRLEPVSAWGSTEPDELVAKGNDAYPHEGGTGTWMGKLTARSGMG
ncbi:MAG: hypothetical protein H5U02_10755 [Clostridia bacterium]|nr:hypothetical protein [Clostridia bacterium]